MSPKTAVVVYVKYPIPGKVKTRLAKAVGADKAAELYAAMIARVLALTLSPLARERFAIIFRCDPIRPPSDYQAYFSPFAASFAPQVGVDLGARLQHSVSETLALFSRIIVIGTDCLAITPSLIEETQRALDDVEVVLGPAKDGGYYLIALKQPTLELFQDIEWSTSSVLHSTLEKTRKLGLKTHLLPELSDIDSVEDLPPDLF